MVDPLDEEKNQHSDVVTHGPFHFTSNTVICFNLCTFLLRQPNLLAGPEVMPILLKIPCGEMIIKATQKGISNAL